MTSGAPGGAPVAAHGDTRAPGRGGNGPTPEEEIAHFESADFDPSGFRHREHVRMAWLYLQVLRPIDALRRYADGLRAIANRVGVPEKYHETVTWAYVIIVNQRMVEDPGRTWDGFAAANPDLFVWPGGTLEAYYRPETLMSDAARLTFLMPDRGTG